MTHSAAERSRQPQQTLILCGTRHRRAKETAREDAATSTQRTALFSLVQHEPCPCLALVSWPRSHAAQSQPPTFDRLPTAARPLLPMKHRHQLSTPSQARSRRYLYCPDVILQQTLRCLLRCSRRDETRQDPLLCERASTYWYTPTAGDGITWRLFCVISFPFPSSFVTPPCVFFFSLWNPLYCTYCVCLCASSYSFSPAS